MVRQKILFVVVFFCIYRAAFTDNDTIGASDASRYVGQKKTVCGKVASTHFASSSSRQPTFLNLDKPYPNQIFTIVIWGSDRDRFPEAPEKKYQGKEICITGEIESYKGKPQIVASSPEQIKIKN